MVSMRSSQFTCGHRIPHHTPVFVSVPRMHLQCDLFERNTFTPIPAAASSEHLLPANNGFGFGPSACRIFINRWFIHTIWNAAVHFQMSTHNDAMKLPDTFPTKLWPTVPPGNFWGFAMVASWSRVSKTWTLSKVNRLRYEIWCGFWIDVRHFKAKIHQTKVHFDLLGNQVSGCAFYNLMPSMNSISCFQWVIGYKNGRLFTRDAVKEITAVLPLLPEKSNRIKPTKSILTVNNLAKCENRIENAIKWFCYIKINGLEQWKWKFPLT